MKKAPIKIKTVLVATNQLQIVGGSETFTYCLITALLKRKFDVEYFTFYKGEVSDRIEKELGVKFMQRKRYDLILANHSPCITYLANRGIIVQTCHGIFPELEQPNKLADGHVAISKEVADHLLAKKFSSKIIWNGIDCERFKPTSSINPTLKNVLSLSQSEAANTKIESACKELGLNFSKHNKYVNPIWNIEKLINSADLVIGLGRSAYEAMACGRAIIVFDERNYFKSYGDGYMTPEKVSLCIEKNCSGRYTQKEFSVSSLIEELKLYVSTDGHDLRKYSLENLNVEKQLNKYLAYAQTLQKKYNILILDIVSSYKYIYMWNKIRAQNRRKRKKAKQNQKV